jgi:hypothetical protein
VLECLSGPALGPKNASALSGLAALPPAPSDEHILVLVGLICLPSGLLARSLGVALVVLRA